MSLFVYLSLCLIDDFVNVLTVKGVLIQSVTATLIGFLSFWLFGYLLKIKELKSFQIKACSILKKRKIKLPVDDYEQENIR
jgi:ammonia channel protein AmtB